MTARNYSRQRDAIKTFLLGRKDHPTAEVIYQNVREEFPNISLGTVYRNLALLTELNEIQKISLGKSFEHYDCNPESHNHFICTKCNCVLDLKMDSIDFITTLASKNFSGDIAGHSTFFYGICESCKNKNI